MKRLLIGVGVLAATLLIVTTWGPAGFSPAMPKIKAPRFSDSTFAVYPREGSVIRSGPSSQSAFVRDGPVAQTLLVHPAIGGWYPLAVEPIGSQWISEYGVTLTRVEAPLHADNGRQARTRELRALCNRMIELEVIDHWALDRFPAVIFVGRSFYSLKFDDREAAIGTVSKLLSEEGGDLEGGSRFDILDAYSGRKVYEWKNNRLE